MSEETQLARADRYECGMASGLDWWCLLRPDHSLPHVPRRSPTPPPPLMPGRSNGVRTA
ncbi:hypothetical protein GCM10010293_40550 [Streptomyces griseoflavus]|nr:hypothetical protein GCM10010293_40550 [Streptomyces griseoflavus]